MQGLEFWILGLAIRARYILHSGLGVSSAGKAFRVRGSGFREIRAKVEVTVLVSSLRVQGLGFRDSGLGGLAFEVQGLVIWIKDKG